MFCRALHHQRRLPPREVQGGRCVCKRTRAVPDVISQAGGRPRERDPLRVPDGEGRIGGA